MVQEPEEDLLTCTNEENWTIIWQLLGRAEFDMTTFSPRSMPMVCFFFVPFVSSIGVSYAALAVGAFLKSSKGGHFSIFKEDDKDALYDAFFRRFVCPIVLFISVVYHPIYSQF
jgi:hypothetical protein